MNFSMNWKGSSGLEEYNVIIEESAQSDLREILNYISETLMEPRIAAGLIGRIRKAIESLDQMPERFPLYDREPWRSQGIRRMNADNFASFYVVMKDSHTVSVLAVIYGGRDIDKVLTEKLND